MFNLKQIISSIGFKNFLVLKVKKNDLESIISLCDDLISHKGAAFGIAVARDITELYQIVYHLKIYYFSKKLMKNTNLALKRLMKQLKIIQNHKTKKHYLIYLRFLRVIEENCLEE